MPRQQRFHWGEAGAVDRLHVAQAVVEVDELAAIAASGLRMCAQAVEDPAQADTDRAGQVGAVHFGLVGGDGGGIEPCAVRRTIQVVAGHEGRFGCTKLRHEGKRREHHGQAGKRNSGQHGVPVRLVRTPVLV